MPPPNIILLFPDQWRGDWLSHLGHPVPTPYTDQLAAEGTSFCRAYSPSPTCIPARAVLATGKTPWHCGRTGYQDGQPWPYPDTVQQRLRTHGYQTMQVGKTHYHPVRLHLGFEISRTYEASVREPGFRSHYHAWLAEQSGGRVQDTALDRDPNAWPVQPWEHEERLHCTRWTADESLACIEHRDPTRPFFLQVGFHRPHAPFDPPKRCWDALADLHIPPPPIGDWVGEVPDITAANAFRGHLPAQQTQAIRRAYAANITFVDEQIGRMLWWLRQRGLDRNTWIILASDHGDSMGDHARLFKGSFLEGSARIPFVVRPATGIPAVHGQIRQEIVDLADILPTCAAIAGCSADDCDGRDLLPLLTGTAVDESIDWQSWHGEHWSAQGVYECLIHQSWKYIYDAKTGAQWLFDLAHDAQECHNRSTDPDQQARVQAFRADLIARLRGRGCGLVRDDALMVGMHPQVIRPEILNPTHG